MLSREGEERVMTSELMNKSTHNPVSWFIAGHGIRSIRHKIWIVHASGNKAQLIKNIGLWAQVEVQIVSLVTCAAQE